MHESSILRMQWFKDNYLNSQKEYKVLDIGSYGVNGTYKDIFDDSNFLSFSTRRNRKINLTEFYDLIYEYKNDCLTAAIQYNKDYYSDNELKPTEEIFFSISIVPLTTLNTPSVR